MQIKALVLLMVSATALAQSLDLDIPTDINIDIPTDIDISIPTDIDISLPTDIDIALPTSIPPEVLNLITAIPSSVQSAIWANPTSWLNDFQSSLMNGLTPDWLQNIPETNRGALSSFADSLGGTTAPGPAPTSGNGGNGNPEGDAVTTASPDLAARPTGAVMAAIAGAAGVLGLAIAL